MVKLRRNRAKTPPPVIDLATDAGRRRANDDLMWGDHGFLRLRFQNLHQISEEMWRSNQPSPQQIADHRQLRGINTIINLRGQSPKGYYLLEREACEANGIDLVDFQVFSRDTPTRDAILGARDLFARIRYPALMHCKSGADRAGLMAVLYKLLRDKAPFETAREQLSLKYLHVKQGKTGVLDAVFDAYAAHIKNDPISFVDWVEDHYDRLAIKEAFMESFNARLRLDRLLGRE